MGKLLVGTEGGAQGFQIYKGGELLIIVYSLYEDRGGIPSA